METLCVHYHVDALTYAGTEIYNLWISFP